jgi:hypothetical protein
MQNWKQKMRLYSRYIFNEKLLAAWLASITPSFVVDLCRPFTYPTPVTHFGAPPAPALEVNCLAEGNWLALRRVCIRADPWRAGPWRAACTVYIQHTVTSSPTLHQALLHMLQLQYGQTGVFQFALCVCEYTNVCILRPILPQLPLYFYFN